MSHVVIGSKNPVKINCVKNVFGRVFPEKEFAFEGIDLASGVSDQPMTDAETLKGAINRANGSHILKPDAIFCLGIEGGIAEIDGALHAFAWVVIQSEKRTGKARTATFPLPSAIRKLLDEGYELGHANDKLFKENNSKQKGGAVGTLTLGMLDRTEYYEQAVLLALVPFINEGLFPA